MGDVNLEELLKSKTALDPTVPVIEPQKEIAKVTEQTEMITAEDRQLIDKIKEKSIDPFSTALQYGNGVQKNIADFSNNILSNVKAKDSGYVGDLMGDLLSKVKSFNGDSGSKKSFIQGIPVIGSLQ